tara:strand:- start:6696 stop:7001 length:306 start_codon:yes stop_codon:yes gene_type:complete
MEMIIDLLNSHPEVVLPFFLNAVVSTAKKSIGSEKMKELKLNRWIVPVTMLLGMFLVYVPFGEENFFFQDVPRKALWIYGACMGFICNGLYSFHKKTILGK